MKTCKQCGETRPLAEFHRQKKARDGYNPWCKKCNQAYTRTWRYGLTPAAFEAMRTAQGNACACCQETFVDTPRVDHCHQTGNVRALLCDGCNKMLGCARDVPRILRAGAAYLELHHSSHKRT